MPNKDPISSSLLQRRLEEATAAIAARGEGCVPDRIAQDVLSSLEALQSSLTLQDSSARRHLTIHDGVVHNPLGSGSYIYKDNFIPALFLYLGLQPGTDHSTIIIHIGAQPNNSPHAGTIIVFALGFLIGREMVRHFRERQQSSEDLVENLEVQVHLDLVDTAPDDAKTLHQDGVTYQKSHRDTQGMDCFLGDYGEIIKSLHDFVNGEVSYEITTQKTLMSMPWIPRIINAIVNDRERLGPELSPGRNVLAIRRACPQSNCGYADKHGRKNTYTTSPSGETIISFFCPVHGRHSVSLSNPSEVAGLEFNTPLRNLVRALAYGQDTIDSRGGGLAGQRVHMRVTGGDYGGMYQEQLLWRQLDILATRTGLPRIPPPVIAYAPLILDWAGSKMSKSLYVVPGAYDYLRERNMDYFLSFKRMKECGRDHKVLFREVEKWLTRTELVFRNFTIDYLHAVFENTLSV